MVLNMVVDVESNEPIKWVRMVHRVGWLIFNSDHVFLNISESQRMQAVSKTVGHEQVEECRPSKIVDQGEVEEVGNDLVDDEPP